MGCQRGIVAIRPRPLARPPRCVAAANGLVSKFIPTDETITLLFQRNQLGNHGSCWATACQHLRTAKLKPHHLWFALFARHPLQQDWPKLLGAVDEEICCNAAIEASPCPDFPLLRISQCVQDGFFSQVCRAYHLNRARVLAPEGAVPTLDAQNDDAQITLTITLRHDGRGWIDGRFFDNSQRLGDHLCHGGQAKLLMPVIEVA